MVKSTIVYFGSLAESKKGLQRTLIAFFVMWICLFFMFKSRSSISKVAVASAATALVLVSAIGVQLPRSLKEAALYGALVGLVVSVSIAATAAVMFSASMEFAATVVVGLTALCSLIASLNFKYFSKIKL